MRISDWSSDVCSSDLHAVRRTLWQGVLEKVPEDLAGWPIKAWHPREIPDWRHLGDLNIHHRGTQPLGQLGEGTGDRRSEERRVGTEWVSTCRSRCCT